MTPTGNRNTGPGLGERTYYVYDLQGVQVRKVTERQTSTATGAGDLLRGRRYPSPQEERLLTPSVSLDADRASVTLHLADDQGRFALLETMGATAAGNWCCCYNPTHPTTPPQLFTNHYALTQPHPTPLPVPL